MSQLERPEMILKQGEWSIIQIGNTKYQNLCNNLVLKTVMIQSGLALFEPKWQTLGCFPTDAFAVNQKALKEDRSVSIPVMVDGIIPEEMSKSVRYDASLNSFRKNSYDAIAIYGFIIYGVDSGIISTTVTIQDGLRLVFKLILSVLYTIQAL